MDDAQDFGLLVWSLSWAYQRRKFNLLQRVLQILGLSRLQSFLETNDVLHADFLETEGLAGLETFLLHEQLRFDRGVQVDVGVSLRWQLDRHL